MTDVRLIIGPPGCGKTTALAREVETRAGEYGGADIAVCSLTRTAAKEIASRVEIPESNVGTLHAHAYRALDRPELAETPEGRRTWNEAYPDYRLTGAGSATKDELDGPGGQGDDDRGSEADDLHQDVMNQRARMAPLDELSDAARQHHARWEDFKAQTGRLDFTDLIERATAETGQHPAHPRTLLGDEAQDFSALELALFRRWAAGADNVILAADPLQSIYAWRGADPYAFDAVDDEHTTVLRQSYRLSGAIHGAAVGWAQREGLAVPDYRPTNRAGQVVASPHALVSPAPIVETLPTDGTVVVLATCSYMLGPLIAQLRADAVPFHNPLRPDHGGWNPMRSARRLAAFLRPDERVWGEAARLWTWDDVRAWIEPLSARGLLTRGAKEWVKHKCQTDKFGQTQANTEAPTEEVASLLSEARPEHTVVHHPAFRGDVGWWAEHLLASQAEKMRFALEVHRRHGGRALVETPRVAVGTVHSFKGGEADRAVVAPDLSKAAMYGGWLQGGEGRAHIARTFYVALSRARESVTVLSPSNAEHVDELLAAEAVVA